ncbi:MAG: AsmA family protein, partial [Elusimicrobia bacterium]|nr:AsmA family protein [Elusimicrobiota bacterium]
MSPIRINKALKSVIAVAVSASLFVTSAGWPAAQAFAQAISAPAGEAGAASRVVAVPAALPPSALPGAGALVPSLSASAAAPLPSAPSAAA